MTDKKQIISEHMAAMASKRWSKLSPRKRKEEMRKVAAGKSKKLRERLIEEEREEIE